MSNARRPASASLSLSLTPGPPGPAACRSRAPRRSAAAWVALGLAVSLVLGGCGIYTLGGPGHGTRFVVPPGALASPDPVVRSWAAYSLAKSTCQLEGDGERPSRYDSYACELRPREVLVRAWRERTDGDVRATGRDAYLDLLVRIDDAGFLAEYVWVALGQRGWIRPDFLRLDAYDRWRRTNVPRHRPQTRIIGWWSSGTADRREPGR